MYQHRWWRRVTRYCHRVSTLSSDHHHHQYILSELSTGTHCWLTIRHKNSSVPPLPSHGYPWLHHSSIIGDKAARKVRLRIHKLFNNNRSLFICCLYKMYLLVYYPWQEYIIMHRQLYKSIQLCWRPCYSEWGQQTWRCNIEIKNLERYYQRWILNFFFGSRFAFDDCLVRTLQRDREDLPTFENCTL